MHSRLLYALAVRASIYLFDYKQTNIYSHFLLEPLSLLVASAAGFYLMDIVMGFHIGFVVRHDVRRRLVLDGWKVAFYYTYHSQFLLNPVACEWQQAGLLAAFCAGPTAASGLPAAARVRASSSFRFLTCLPK